MKPVICVDFDGVLNNYQGWQGEKDLSIPRFGAKEFMKKLGEKYTVVVFTARNIKRVHDWLVEYGFPFDDVTRIKPPAVAYIDDRGVCFDGDYDKVLNVVDDFRPYWDVSV